MWGWAYSLPFHGDGWWYISRFTGSLLHSTHPPPFIGRPIASVIQALEYCNDPYQCEWTPNTDTKKLSIAEMKCLTRADEALFKLGNSNFLLSILYSGLKEPIFDTTKQAFSAIANLPNHQGEVLDKCFQRTLLAAKTSRSFSHGGVIFIGADLSSLEMHAWIIENGQQPDHEDRSWINYRPLLAIVNS